MSRTALELLRLLAQDAPAERIEEQTRALATADPESGAVARELALRVRAGIDGHRRREAELSALVDIARDLASHPEPGGVLDTIVRRARGLLGADVAYLTLADAQRGDTFMRATAGSVSARFQALRLPLGAGLGGLVAQTRRPYWTADYPGDARYDHTREIDEAVEEEGLVAICGTPLLVDGEFVGVLFAAHRARRPFARAEVALLGSLAALAAVSLLQSRRAAETAGALAALSSAHAGIEQAAAAHDRFAGVVLSGGGVDDIAAALGDLLGCWVAVLDVDGQRLAAHGAVPDEVAGALAVRRAADSGRLVSTDGTCAVAVRAVGQRLGTLVLGGRADLDDGQVRTVERAAMVTALVLLFRLREAEADQRVRTDLLAELLARPAAEVDTTLVERGRLLGLRLQTPHVVAVCRGRRRGVAPAAAAAGDGHGLAGEHHGEVVAVVPGRDASAVATRLARHLGGDGTPVTVGAAGPVVPAAGLRDAHAAARRTTDALTAIGKSAGSARDLGFAGLVSGTAEIDGYLDRVLGPVASYDARRGSDLLGTLDAYFAAGGSPRRAAGALHVHVNTVAQRLERVTTLLGADWQAPDHALELQLALRLRRLRRETGGGDGTPTP
ncbi:helix-turn-helix domain-containing protein [Pseudonocardia sp. MH-G8]|uniref:helix-turn-helix domain-containing protein n=1 Tax=Pseudonocardia sp. MH-G8 TaxID=1854588 RepID=UPI001E4A0ED9|nr:helix-turn-helix domain-containing protein [Pseudonocardia sp. MH-G8]